MPAMCFSFCPEIAQVIEQCRICTFVLALISQDFQSSEMLKLGHGSLQVSTTFMDFRHDSVDIREEVEAILGAGFGEKGSSWFIHAAPDLEAQIQ